MIESGMTLSTALGWLTQFLIGFAGIAAILHVAARRRSRWQISIKLRNQSKALNWFLKAARVNGNGKAMKERETLFSRCGISFPPDLYTALRRLLFGLLAIAACGLRVAGNTGVLPATASWNGMIGCALLAGAALFDRQALDSYQRYRTDRIRRELVAVGQQLLYYAGSRLHLHGKLLRCVPLTRLTRGEMGLLLNEWYYDADGALRRFKERLGTSEAYGFTECVRTLKQHENEEVYELLREMVREQKAKIDLAKGTRKETVSYVLFVLAGIPILYTFQLFLYPWVQEAAKLFDSLNP